MSIDFTVAEDDVVAFHLDHARGEHGPPSKGQRLTFALVACLLMSVALWSSYGFLALVGGLVIGIGVFLFFPWMNASITEAKVRALHTGGANPTVLGSHRMAFTSDSIDVESSASRHSFNWSTIQSLVETERHLFVYVGPTRALIIPTNGTLHGASVKEIIAEIKNHVAQVRHVRRSGA